jgi:hypothetical protein
MFHPKMIHLVGSTCIVQPDNFTSPISFVPQGIHPMDGLSQWFFGPAGWMLQPFMDDSTLRSLNALIGPRITQTGQSGEVGLTGQPGQLKQERTERTGCQDMTIMTGIWGRRVVDKSRTAGTGQAGQDRWTGQYRQDR